jgi:hypothetical protein
MASSRGTLRFLRTGAAAMILASAVSAQAPVQKIEADGTTPLHWAVRADDRKGVEKLLQS